MGSHPNIVLTGPGGPGGPTSPWKHQRNTVSNHSRYENMVKKCEKRREKTCCIKLDKSPKKPQISNRAIGFQNGKGGGMGQHKEQKKVYSGITFHMHHVGSITVVTAQFLLMEGS